MTTQPPAPLPEAFDNGPAVSAAEFEAVFDALKRWDDDPAAPVHPGGAPAGVTSQELLAALATPTAGEVISLSLPWDRTGGDYNPRPPLHHMVDVGDVEPPEPSAHKDFIAIDYHGKAVSHLDALCHIGYRGRLYGGVPSADAFSSLGSEWAAVTELSTRLILRGVLVDVPALRGERWLEPGTAVHSDDLLAAEQAHGFSIGRSDAVLLRSGHQARRAELGPWDADAASAGLHLHALSLLAERGIGLLGADGDSDVRPSPVAGVHSPVHALALTALGIPLLDNLDLEALSAACARAGRYEFLLVVAPLVVPRGTGSPVNPLAVL